MAAASPFPYASPLDAFVDAVNHNPFCRADVIPNGPAKPLKIRVEYPDEKSHLVVETPLGSVRIIEIDFDGELSIIETKVPRSPVAEYRTVGQNEAVAQTAAFYLDVDAEFFRRFDSDIDGVDLDRVILRRLRKMTRPYFPKLTQTDWSRVSNCSHYLHLASLGLGVH